jgi:DNA anti-recombination protein RmuC
MVQAQNQEAIYDTARQLLDRVADFIESFEGVNKKLQEASATFQKASEKLYTGRQSIVGASNKLISLGAKTSSAKKVIPEVKESLRGIE